MYFQKMQFLGVFRPFLQRSLNYVANLLLSQNTKGGHVSGKLALRIEEKRNSISSNFIHGRGNIL